MPCNKLMFIIAAVCVVFFVSPTAYRCCQNNDGLSICHNGPTVWAQQSQYYAGQHPTSRFLPCCEKCSVLLRANPKRKHKLNRVPSLIWQGAKPLAHSHKGAYAMERASETWCSFLTKAAVAWTHSSWGSNMKKGLACCWCLALTVKPSLKPVYSQQLWCNSNSRWYQSCGF